MPAVSNYKQKLISFPNPLYAIANQKVKRIGISFSEYVRFLMIRDIETEFQEMPILGKKTIKEITQAMLDYKKERYTRLTTAKEIQKHFAKL